MGNRIALLVIDRDVIQPCSPAQISFFDFGSEDVALLNRTYMGNRCFDTYRLNTVTIGSKSQSRIRKRISDTTVCNAESIEHFSAHGHLQYRNTRTILQTANTQPLRHWIVVIHLIYNSACFFNRIHFPKESNSLHPENGCHKILRADPDSPGMKECVRIVIAVCTYLWNMYRGILLTAFILCTCTYVFAQKTESDDYVTNTPKTPPKEVKPPFRDRLVFGGNLGGAFGTNSYFQINPMVGYKTTSWWVNGVGLNYIYASSAGIRQNIIGGSIWSRAYLFKNFILHTEYEQMQRSLSDNFGNRLQVNVPVWFVGGGYQNNVGGGIGISALVLFDVINDPNSPYISPVVRIGGLWGF